MTDQVDKKDEEVSFLEMSDEDLMKMSAPTGNATSETEDDSEDNADDSDDQEDSKDEANGADDKEDAAEDQTDDSATDEKEKDDSAEGKAESDKQDAKEDASEKVEPKSEDQKEAEIDYKSEYEKVFAPFKANGRDFTVKSADDAIALMQMGANYNKKMAALKPNLQLMKLLEKNDLLDEGKLSYLIDLDKKNPEAINKLIKDSGIDPMDLDAEKASGYKPNTYTVDERELELDTVLEELQGTPTYTRTLEVVGNKWDGASKRAIADSPQLLKVINGHMSSGVYDIIASEMEHERTLGRLNGLSDIQAYKQVGDSIQARNGFDHLGKSSETPTPKPAVIVPPKLKAEDDDKLRDKKRAASSTKPVAANSVNKDFNPLALSDEEFSKMGNAKFL